MQFMTGGVTTWSSACSGHPLRLDMLLRPPTHAEEKLAQMRHTCFAEPATTGIDQTTSNTAQPVYISRCHTQHAPGIISHQYLRCAGREAAMVEPSIAIAAATMFFISHTIASLNNRSHDNYGDHSAADNRKWGTHIASHMRAAGQLSKSKIREFTVRDFFAPSCTRDHFDSSWGHSSP